MRKVNVGKDNRVKCENARSKGLGVSQSIDCLWRGRVAPSERTRTTYARRGGQGGRVDVTGAKGDGRGAVQELTAQTNKSRRGMGTHPKERSGEVVKESRGGEDTRRHEKGYRRTGTEREMQQQGDATR
jgi:hypothetical protein